MHQIPENDLNILKDAYIKNKLTFYLGAGVSVDNGLPTWEKLILAMYFSTISEQKLGGWRPYSNYLFAIAEWYLENSSEPLEITARKLRKYYSCNEDKFLEKLYITLYGGFLNPNYEPDPAIDVQQICTANPTLCAVAKLCQFSEVDSRGIKSVITYNYDNLLEIALGKFPFQSIFDNSILESDKLPIYHVHGFVPLSKDLKRSNSGQIVFTEDQYHKVARDSYYWSNLVQLQSMSSNIGLMIGLSLSDRNMRRLLDAIQNAPLDSKNYILLKEPSDDQPNDEVLDKIHKKAIKYLNRFKMSGIKTDQDYESGVLHPHVGIKSSHPVPNLSIGIKGRPVYREEIAEIINQVKSQDLEQQEFVMKELGITPIWFSEYSEIPDILNQLI